MKNRLFIAQEALERKIQEVAAATKRSPAEVRTRITLFGYQIRAAPQISIGDVSLKDMRAWYLGEGDSLDLLAAQVAALAGGYTVLLRHRDAVGKPEKWSISGHASPSLIESFMREWAPAQGLTNIDGAPARGYAEGYLPEEHG